eukprot:TRINITY_DN102786_c0_g1_i1.p1 TRINITY_DN102786_c0_g1~~TRINITY_DN102786_c0_g1_i1.p1  ORF type:complete len:172 (+),score=41.96 TRINITY_DN102786_c0_g1_i1:79-594(+)
MARSSQRLRFVLCLMLVPVRAFLAPTSQPKIDAAIALESPLQARPAALAATPQPPMYSAPSAPAPKPNVATDISPASAQPTPQPPMAAAAMAPTPPPRKSAKKSSCEDSCWQKVKKEKWGVCDAMEKRYNDVQGKHPDHADAAKRAYRMCSQGMRQARDVCEYHCQGSDEL